MTSGDAIVATRRWLERAVIGLNLCPFAKAVHVRQQVRFVVSEATNPEGLLDALERELAFLRDTDSAVVETTLLIHPVVLNDFLEYNDFLDVADRAVASLGLRGRVQIASFHPDYRFAGAQADAIGNYTNRAPFPILHLLREESVARAVEAIPDADSIVDRNLATLAALGVEGWDRLMRAE